MPADIGGKAGQQIIGPCRIGEVEAELHEIEVQPLADDARPERRRHPALDAEGQIDAERNSRHLVAPMVRPRIIWRLTASAKTVTGSTISVPVAMIFPQGSS